MSRRRNKALRWLFEKSLVAFLAVAGTVGVFMILPMLQAIGQGGGADHIVRSVDSTVLPPPPPPVVEEEPEEEEVEEEPPPELTPEAPPLDLSQLQLALDPGLGDGLMGDFALELGGAFGSDNSSELDEIFSMADLDQRPRAIFQRQPSYPTELRKKRAQGTVEITFTVDVRGRVTNPKVSRSTHPAFDKAAMDAVKQWRFEPGVRSGEKVPFKMRVPITFNPPA